MRTSRREAARAQRSPFQAGCDARYGGRPLAECPYNDEWDAREWRAGWCAVDAAMARASFVREQLANGVKTLAPHPKRKT